MTIWEAILWTNTLKEQDNIIVMTQTFNSYLTKLTVDQKKAWEELSKGRGSGPSLQQGQGEAGAGAGGVVGKKLSRGWVDLPGQIF